MQIKPVTYGTAAYNNNTWLIVVDVESDVRYLERNLLARANGEAKDDDVSSFDKT